MKHLIRLSAIVLLLICFFMVSVPFGGVAFAASSSYHDTENIVPIILAVVGIVLLIAACIRFPAFRSGLGRFFIDVLLHVLLESLFHGGGHSSDRSSGGGSGRSVGSGPSFGGGHSSGSGAGRGRH